MAFREAQALLVGEQRPMVVGGGGCPERVEQEKLAKGRADQVRAAHHLGHTELGVVHRAGELIARVTILPPDEEVAKIAAGERTLRTEMPVVENHLAAVGHAEAPVAGEARGVERRERRSGRRSPGGRVERLVVGGRAARARALVRSGKGPGEIFARAMAGEDQSYGVKAGESSAVAIQAGGLKHGRLLPAQAEPREILQRGGGELRPATRRIEIVDTKEQASARGAGPGRGEREGASVPEVQAAGGRGREAADVGAAGEGGGWVGLGHERVNTFPRVRANALSTGPEPEARRGRGPHWDGAGGPAARVSALARRGGGRCVGGFPISTAMSSDALDTVKALIPHRPPFLFVDEIVSESADGLVGKRTWRADEDFYRGHYPGAPITPGVLLCEAVFQTAALFISKQARGVGGAEAGSGVPLLSKISDVRFRTPIYPGDTVLIEVKKKDVMAGFTMMSGSVKKPDGTRVLNVDFTVAWKTPEGQQQAQQ